MTIGNAISSSGVIDTWMIEEDNRLIRAASVVNGWFGFQAIVARKSLMPLPEGHAKSLGYLLTLHEDRKASLHSHISSIDSVIREEEKSAARMVARPPRRPVKAKNVELLRGQRELLERELGIHDMLMGIAQDSSVHDVLGELAENPRFARDASLDPMKVARERGIEVPDRMRLHLQLNGSIAVLRVEYFEELYPFVVTWDSKEGFSNPVADG